MLVDDSIGIIAMIKCRTLAAQFELGERTVALIRSNFSKENMDLLRNGYNRFLDKPVKPWVLRLATSQDAVTSTNGSAPADRSLEKLKSQRLRMLLVDDSNDNLFLLKALVEPITDVVHVAENGLQALEKFRINSYDVVFMDLQMPVMDGYSVSATLASVKRVARARHRLRSPPTPAWSTHRNAAKPAGQL